MWHARTEAARQPAGRLEALPASAAGAAHRAGILGHDAEPQRELLLGDLDALLQDLRARSFVGGVKFCGGDLPEGIADDELMGSGRWGCAPVG